MTKDLGSCLKMWHDIIIYTTYLPIFNGQIVKYKNKDFVDAKYSNVSAMASQKMYQHINWQNQCHQCYRNYGTTRSQGTINALSSVTIVRQKILKRFLYQNLYQCGDSKTLPSALAPCS